MPRGRARRFAAFMIHATFLVALGAPRAAAQGTESVGLHGMTVDDLLKVEVVDAAAVDDGGSLVAVVVQRARRAGEPIHQRAYYGDVRADVVVLSAATGQVLMRTRGHAEHAGYWHPVWSPSGKRLAMLALHGDTLTVCLWQRGRRAVECQRDGRSAVERQRDGRSLDYLTQMSVGATSDMPYRRDNAFLWLSDSVLAVALLPPGQFDLQTLRSHWMADSVAATWARQARGAESTASVLDSPWPTDPLLPSAEIRLWNVEDGTVRTAFHLPYFSQGYRLVVLSPDHERAAVLADRPYSAPHATARLGSYDRTHTQLGVVDLTRDTTVWWAPRYPYTRVGRWRSDGRRFGVMVKRADDESVLHGTMLLVIDPVRRTADSAVMEAGRDTAFQWEEHRGPVAGSHTKLAPGDHLLAVAPNGAFAIVRRLGATGTSVWLIPSGGKGPHVLLSVNRHLARVAAATRMLITYTALDGTAQRGVVLLPPGFRRGVRYPLVAWLYPGSVYTDTLNTGWLRSEDDQFFLNPNVLAGHGYAVLFPSMPAGSDRVARDPCIHVPDAVMPAIDTLIARNIADATRLGVMGHSYGGYATNCIIAHSHRFRAAVSSAPVTDMTSYALQFQANSRYTGSPDLALRWVASGGGMGNPPWRDPARYVRNSPVYRADSVQTPVLISSGDNDFIGQSEEWFTALLGAGKCARLVRYWGEGHLLDSPANIRHLWGEILNWFDKYLEPSPVDRGHHAQRGAR